MTEVGKGGIGEATDHLHGIAAILDTSRVLPCRQTSSIARKTRQEPHPSRVLPVISVHSSFSSFSDGLGRYAPDIPANGWAIPAHYTDYTLPCNRPIPIKNARQLGFNFDVG